MPEMRRLVTTAIHVVRRPANRREFLQVKADTSSLGGDTVPLSDEEIQGLQTVLDTSIPDEDRHWQKIASALEDPTEADEVTTRRGLRLLTATAKKSEESTLGEVLTELGFVLEPKEPQKKTQKTSTSSGSDSDPPSRKTSKSTPVKLVLPDSVVTVMKAAGVEPFVDILKSLETSPEASNAFMPLIAALCTKVQKQDEELLKTAEEKRATEITQAVREMGLETDQSALVEVLKGLDTDQREKMLKALAPGLEKVKEAESLLLMESGTEARKTEGQTALSRAEGLARQMVSKDEAEDFDSALERVWNDHPALYAQHRVESYSEQVGGISE